MKYLSDVPFSAGAATQAYRDGWDAVFGTNAETPEAPKPCPCESGKPFAACHGQTEDEDIAAK